ncbi:MAG: ATP-binding protein, partial [Bacteroidota bacterium]
MKTNYQYSSPFNYLSPYEKEDKQIFFGRTDEVDEIFNLYKTTNLVILYGKSGTGKTSLAQCGLANKFNDWKSITIRRKNDFVESFFESLINLFGEDFKNQLKNLFNEIITNSQSEKEGELNQEKLDRFDALLNEKKETVSYIPFFIFDQFEELFIEGNKNETKNFSLLLSLITKNVTFSNNLICIQSEFFSDLLVFEKYYNPNILDFKYFIKDPHVDNTREILLKTFKHFGINQVRIDDSKPTEEIHQNIQNERINKIIEFLKESNRVYLPFLQIYLDKLYVEDFIRTYPDHGELLLNPKAIIFKEKPLEFTDKEIDDHGNIEKILTDYIQEINDALIEKENNIYGNEHRDTVIKFLKYFVSEQNTKKTIPIIPKREYNLYTKINDKELQNQIAKKIWKNIPLELEQSIGDIIDELLKARILKQKGNFIELSHNLLAKIISEIYVDEHIQEYYKKHFESSFQTYKKQKNEGVKKSFLNPSLVRQIEDDIDLIIGDDPNKKEKLDFWRLSKKRVENKIYINLLVIFSVIITVVFFASLNFIKEFAYNDLNEKNESLEEMKNQFLNDKNGLQGEKERRQDISRDIYFTAKNNNEDPTKKYKDFSKIISKINDDDSLIPTKDFPLLFIQYNELLLNYTKTPFYIDITSDLTESASKISIKKVNNNTYYVIIKTKNRLFSKTINLQNRDISNWISELDEEVSEYSTYDESKINKNNNKLKENSKQTIIYSNSDGLHKKELNVKKAKQIGPKLKDLSILTHLRNNIFIGLSKNKKIIYKIVAKQIIKLQQPVILKFFFFCQTDYLNYKIKFCIL